MTLCLFLKYLQLDIKSIGSLRSARINEFDVRGFCYLGSNDTHVASGIQNASDKRPKSVFGRNVYDTDATNSILEIGLDLHCSLFE
jgi:hypothetical protein